HRRALRPPPELRDRVPAPPGALQLGADLLRRLPVEPKGRLAAAVAGLLDLERRFRLRALRLGRGPELEERPPAVRAALLLHRRVRRVERQDRPAVVIGVPGTEPGRGPE